MFSGVRKFNSRSNSIVSVRLSTCGCTCLSQRRWKSKRKSHQKRQSSYQQNVAVNVNKFDYNESQTQDHTRNLKRILYQLKHQGSKNVTYSSFDDRDAFQHMQFRVKLNKCGNGEDIYQLLKDSVAVGMKCVQSATTWSIAIEKCCHLGIDEWQNCLKIIEMACNSDIVMGRDIMFYEKLFKAANSNGCDCIMDLYPKYFNHMINHDKIEPNAAIINMLVKACWMSIGNIRTKKKKLLQLQSHRT